MKYDKVNHVISFGRCPPFLQKKCQVRIRKIGKKNFCIQNSMSVPLIQLWGKRGTCSLHSKSYNNIIQHWMKYHDNYCYDCCRNIVGRNWFRHCSSLLHQRIEKGGFKTSLNFIQKNIPQADGKLLFCFVDNDDFMLISFQFQVFHYSLRCSIIHR